MVDPDDPTWAADLGDAEASLLSRARDLALSSLLQLLPLVLLLKIVRSLGPMPLRAYRALRHPRDRVRAEVLAVMPTNQRHEESVTLRIRVGEDDYSWDATLPSGCVPYVGGSLDLRGDVCDGGRVMAVDPDHGIAYPRATLRQWGREPVIRTGPSAPAT